ncbi:MAG TPA: hypothetical protein PKH24_19100, partial [Sedimentisphaerales bacterium]|nr:hypothetical protein [Sedimentisphaerales bacterium]HNU31094.1 hypothetical protein [Sedimentisphaerales bacterium]
MLIVDYSLFLGREKVVLMGGAEVREEPIIFPQDTIEKPVEQSGSIISQPSKVFSHSYGAQWRVSLSSWKKASERGPGEAPKGGPP